IRDRNVTGVQTCALPIYLNARRSAIQGTENRAGSNVIRVEVPLSQMFGYATDLRSRTQGRATFTMHFSHYAEAPTSIAQEVIERSEERRVGKECRSRMSM